MNMELDSPVSRKIQPRTINSPLWKFYKRMLKLLTRFMPGYQIRRSLLKAAGYSIGEDVYIGEDLIIIDELEEVGYLNVGNRVAIAERVTLILSSRPNFSRIAPFMPTSHGPVTIEDDAWLGTGSIVMPNTTIGRGAVIGANALVTKDIPPFTVAVGTPAKPVRKLEIPDMGVSGEA